MAADTKTDTQKEAESAPRLFGVRVVFYSISVVVMLIIGVICLGVHLRHQEQEKALLAGLVAKDVYVKFLTPEALYMRPDQADTILTVRIAVRGGVSYWNYCFIKGSDIKSVLLENPIDSFGGRAGAARPVRLALEEKLSPHAVEQCVRLNGE